MLAVAPFVPAGAKAGFFQPPDSLLVISSTSLSTFSHAFDRAGRLKRAQRFGKIALETHVEQGFTPDQMFLWRLSREELRPHYLNDPGYQRTISGTFGTRLALWRGAGWTFSGQAVAGFGVDLRRSGIVAEARLLAARPIEMFARPGFLDVQIGYRLGGPGERPEWRFDANLGLDLSEQFLLIGQVFLARGEAWRGLDPSWRLKVSKGLVWRIDQTWSVQISGFTTPYGHNTPLESGATLAVWRRF